VAGGTNASALTVNVNTAAAAIINGGIAVNFFTAGTVGGVSNGLGEAAANSANFGVVGTIQAQGQIVNQASPVINTPTINLGAVRVGAASPTGAVSVTNVATTAPQAALNASITPTSGPITASGSFNLLNPGSTNSTSLVVGLNTGTAGDFTGANAGKATIALVSDASNIGGCGTNCQLTLPSQSVNVAGKVYTAAVGQLTSPTTINFGTVRVGTSVGTQDITITNNAAVTALNDTLNGTLTVSGTGFSGNGASVSGIAAQTSNGAGTLKVGIDTTTAGVKSGSAQVGFASHNPDMADLALSPSSLIALSGTVNAIASPVFSKTSGAATFSGSGTSYTLNLGNLIVGSGLFTDTLQLQNLVSGPADDLLGNFSLANLGLFTGAGFGSVDLSPNAILGGLTLNFDASALGTYSASFTFSGASHNAFQTDLALNTITINLLANVITQGTVPEPGTLALLALGLLALGLAQRQHRRARRR
jgi:hypothetical protein